MFEEKAANDSTYPVYVSGNAAFSDILYRFKFREGEYMTANKQNSKNLRGYITPLFWQHGEEETLLRNEIQQMEKNGIGGFIVESRPHPDFLGVRWWRDMDIILDEAKKRSMKVWFFDDSKFPSGFAAGKIRDNHPEYLKVFLDERHIDAVGPLKGSSFIIDAWLKKDEQLIGVIAARRKDGFDSIDGGSLADLSEMVSDGVLYWDVPEGSWRIFIFVRTRDGGEDGLKHYLNNIEPEPVDAYLKYVYEEFYKHYANEFRETIAGFFSDEPRLGNACTYEALPGKKNMHAPYSEGGALLKMVLPFSNRLLEQLNKAWDGDFRLCLPCLWYDAGELSHHVRYVYMNVVSRLFSECYTQKIGDWCRRHGVQYIGHVIEDNGAHARLGYGDGHFFRAIRGQDCSGFDIVFQVWPELKSGRFSSPFGYLDLDFFYWGLAKMASSAAHIDPGKNGRTVCEIFGAYGWQEGLKLMKWLTDHVCVRGANWLIPHAFSPKYPDSDCPPHFYAAGNNPQWRYFDLWSGYANRVCSLLTGGRHIAPVAVIYHAEAEWSGACMPFEKVVRVLAERQIDCDVVPIDTLVDREALILRDGIMQINKEEFHAVVIPYAQRLPEEFIHCLQELALNKIHVIFINSFPLGSSDRPKEFYRSLEQLKKNSYVAVCKLKDLPEKVTGMGLGDIYTDSGMDYLRYYHYISHDGNILPEYCSKDIYFFTNESRSSAVNTMIRLKNKYTPAAYDAMEDRIYRVDYLRIGESVEIKLHLDAFESMFIIFMEKEPEKGSINKKLYPDEKCKEYVIQKIWNVSTFVQSQKQEFFCRMDSLRNLAVPDLLPGFSGSIRYETEFEFWKAEKAIKSIILDLGEAYESVEVWINEIHAGSRISPPYRFDVNAYLKEGLNKLRIDVTNTLAKKLGRNVFDRAMAQEPTGLIGPVRLLFWLEGEDD